MALLSAETTASAAASRFLSLHGVGREMASGTHNQVGSGVARAEWETSVAVGEGVVEVAITEGA